MISTRPIQHEDHPAILDIVKSLHGWFNDDAHDRAIPSDLRHQDGFVAVSGAEVVGFITLVFFGVAPLTMLRLIQTGTLPIVKELARLMGGM